MNFSIWEVIMLLTFGISWPVAIYKTVKVKNPTGKSYLFMVLIIAGYAAGCIHKVLYHHDIVLYLYIFNALLVTTDLVLCLYYRNKRKKLNAQGNS